MTLEKKLLSILSGLMLTASFPPYHLSWLAWVALLPLLMSLDNVKSSEALRLGFLAGMVHFLTLIYWIIWALNHYGNLSFLESLGPLFLLCFYLSLYLALFSWACVPIRDRFLFPWFFIAAFWVALEYVRAHFLTGFPWCLLGYSQYSHLQLIQVANITGVYGVSFLIVLANGLLYALLFRPSGRGKTTFGLEISLGVLLLVASVVYGTYSTIFERTAGSPEPSIRCAIIQPDIDQSVKWNPAYQVKTIKVLERLTKSTFSSKPRLIVWPETAVPFYFQDRSFLSDAIVSLARSSGANLLFGSPAYRRTDKRYVYYNRAYLLHPDGRTEYYDKVHLVPFGEYVPLKRFLFFASHLVAGAGDFEPGKRIAPLKDGNLSIGPLICFEAIFPNLARIQTKKGAEILVNLTDDAWFGTTSAPYQHLAMAVFRAVENRRPLIRAANTGISAFISPFGKIWARSGLFRQAALVRDIRPVSNSLTLYTRFGDVFALFMCGISLGVLCWFTFTGRKFQKKGRRDDGSRL